MIRKTEGEDVTRSGAISKNPMNYTPSTCPRAIERLETVWGKQSIDFKGRQIKKNFKRKNQFLTAWYAHTRHVSTVNGQ